MVLRSAIEVMTSEAFNHFRLFTGLAGDNLPRAVAASGLEHRNRAENRAVYGV
jgi:hypothetical protein